MSVGVPIKLIHEAQGHIITIELKNGSLYRGKLIDAEDSMNVQLKDITCTGRDGRISHLDQVYVRGSQIRFIIVPDMLKNAPLFKRMTDRTRGTAKGAAMAAAAAARGGRSSGRGRF